MSSAASADYHSEEMPERSPARGDRMIFIVGVGRSGTSLLQSMLNAHPDVCFPPETSFVRNYLSRREIERVHRSGGAKAVVDRLVSDPLIERLQFDRGEIERVVESAGPSLTDAALYRELLRAHARRKGKAEWLGDKDPRSVEFLPVIHRCFAQAWVLHIIRDPRDILVSKKKADWSRKRPSAYHVFANRVQFQLGRKHGKELFGERYIEIGYERLIAAPHETLTEVCSKLGLRFDEAMLDFEGSSRELVTKNEMQWKKETLGPLLPENKGKWKKSLTTWEAALSEKVCGGAFDLMGYERSNSARDLTPPQRAALPFFAAAFVISGAAYVGFRQWRTAR